VFVSHFLQFFSYLNIDKSILERSNSAQLESAERELKRIVNDKLNIAIKNDDLTNILRYKTKTKIKIRRDEIRQNII
jgi:hypothetical protein